MQGRWAQVIASQGMPVIAAAYITNAASDEEPEAIRQSAETRHTMLLHVTNNTPEMRAYTQDREVKACSE